MGTISVVIPTIAGREELLDKLLSTIPKIREVIIVDGEMSLAEKRNYGASQAKGKYVLFIDDDNYLATGAIENMIKNWDDSIGVIGMVACYDDKPNIIADGGSIRNYLTGFTYDNFVNKNVDQLPKSPYEVSEVANAFMIRRQVWRKLKGFDEYNFPIDLDEADFCMRAKKVGYKIVMNPQAICYHKSVTYSRLPDFRRPKNAYFMGRNKIIYQRKHSNLFFYFNYLLFFMPISIGVYCFALLLRRKPEMIKHFLKGVCDALSGRRQNQFQ